MTFTTANGVKIRCTSQRAYVIMVEYTKNGETVARIEKRTDSLVTARKEKARDPQYRRIYSLVTGELVR